MNKEKVVYRFKRHQGKVIQAKREVSYEIMLTSRLILDELCFQWNKEQLVDAINESIEKKDHEAFKKNTVKHIDNLFGNRVCTLIESYQMMIRLYLTRLTGKSSPSLQEFYKKRCLLLLCYK